MAQTSTLIIAEPNFLKSNHIYLLYAIIPTHRFIKKTATRFQFRDGYADRQDSLMTPGLSLSQLTTASWYLRLTSQQVGGYAQTQLLPDLRVPRSLDHGSWHFPELPFKQLAPKLRLSEAEAQILSVSNCAPVQASLFYRKPRGQVPIQALALPAACVK